MGTVWKILVFLSLSLLFLGGACTRSTPRTALRIQLNAEPVSLDPALSEDGVSMKVLGNTMDGLVGFDASGKLENRLADSFTRSPDGKRLEFHLRPGVRWSDGRAVQAMDFIAGIRRSLDPRTGSKTATLLYPIRGARDFHQGKASAEGLGLREENGKVVVELERPAPYFVQALALTETLPIRTDILAANGGRWREDGPVTGPYRIVAHLPDQRIVLQANANYWGTAPKIPRVELWIVPDESTGAHLFDRSEVDILTKISPLDRERYEKAGALRRDPFYATYYLAFNVKKSPFRDVAWRKAVAGSIRKPEIVAALGSGELPASSWIPPGLEGYFPYTNPARVVARRARLTEPVAAGFDSSSRNAIVMEKIQAELAQTLGLKVTLANLDWKSYIRLLQTDPPALFRFAWLAPFADPVPHLQVFTSGNPNNYTGWSSPRYDRLVEQVEGMDPGPERGRKILAAQKMILEEDAAVVPVYHYIQTHVVSSRVEGFRVNPFGIIEFGKLNLTDR